MNKVSLWTKIRFYFSYRKIIKRIKKDLAEKYNLRVDRAKRIYTVVNIPKDMFDEPYNMRTSDINKISEAYLSEYIKQISALLDQSGLSELYRLYDVSKVDKYSYLVVIGYSLFDTGEFLKKFLFRYLPISILVGVITYLFFHFSQTF